MRQSVHGHLAAVLTGNDSDMQVIHSSDVSPMWVQSKVIAYDDWDFHWAITRI